MAMHRAAPRRPYSLDENSHFSFDRSTGRQPVSSSRGSFPWPTANSHRHDRGRCAPSTPLAAGFAKLFSTRSSIRSDSLLRRRRGRVRRKEILAIDSANAAGGHTRGAKRSSDPDCGFLRKKKQKPLNSGPRNRLEVSSFTRAKSLAIVAGRSRRRATTTARNARALFVARRYYFSEARRTFARSLSAILSSRRKIKPMRIERLL